MVFVLFYFSISGLCAHSFNVEQRYKCIVPIRVRKQKLLLWAAYYRILQNDELTISSLSAIVWPYSFSLR